MSKFLRQSIVPIAAVADAQTEVGRVLPLVSTPSLADSQPLADQVATRTQKPAFTTNLAVPRALGTSKRLILLLVLVLPLAACNDDSLSNFLNGGSASAKSDRQSYIPGSTATQAEINRLQYYAPGQSTGAMHDVLGSPDSTTPQADYYYAPDRNSMVVVPYDAAGNWTGKVESAPAPVWQPSPYPGAQ